jgi:TPR repeat protein
MRWGRTVVAGLLIAFLTACAPSLEDGLAAYADNDYEQAAKILASHPESGEASYAMYRMFAEGLGVAKDVAIADEWLVRAASLGQVDALLAKGSAFVAAKSPTPNDVKEGLAMLERAAAAGKKEALVSLGEFYLTSAGRDGKRGEAYLLRAAPLAKASWALAWAYELGQNGLLRNQAKALEQWRLVESAPDASQHLRSYAAFKIDEALFYGNSVARSPEQAAQRLASRPNDDLAQGMYAWLLYRGEGVAQDKLAAVKIVQKMEDPKTGMSRRIAGGANQYALLVMASAYEEGIGHDRDRARAKTVLNSITPGFVAFEAGGFWRLILSSNGVGGIECSPGYLIVPVYVKDAQGSPYQSLAAQALQSAANCMMTAYAGEPDKFARSVLLQDSDRYLHGAETLAPGSARASIQRLASLRSGKGGVSVGMSKAEVLASSWGKPQSVNTTTTRAGKREQWVYGGNNYLYFEDGVLEVIQN